MTVNTKIAFMFAKHSFAPIQVFVQADDLIFAMFATISPHKTSKAHAPIRMELAEQPTI